MSQLSTNWYGWKYQCFSELLPPTTLSFFPASEPKKCCESLNCLHANNKARWGTFNLRIIITLIFNLSLSFSFSLKHSLLCLFLSLSKTIFFFSFQLSRLSFLLSCFLFPHFTLSLSLSFSNFVSFSLLVLNLASLILSPHLSIFCLLLFLVSDEKTFS